jgi:peptide-methionine (R)-S-oxide reductase
MLNWKKVLELAKNGNLTPPKRIEKSEQEWEEQLSSEAYYVTRNKGTERPNSSDMCTLFVPGKYACACCKTELFDSTEKFDSGTGWPSFTQPLDPTHVAYHVDASLASVRVETTCNICDAHLGHVFPDGPAPSGLRYCINAVALKKVKL